MMLDCQLAEFRMLSNFHSFPQILNYICLLTQTMRYGVQNKQQSSCSAEKHNREESGLKSKLRSSVQNMKHLRIELNRLRTTLSSTCLNYFERLPSTKKINDSLTTHLKKKSISNSPTKLMMKFGHLQSKLQIAKGCMQSIEKNSAQIKPVLPKLQFKQQLATCNESKECILESDNKKEKPSLRNFTSMKNLPSVVKVTANPYLGRGQKYYIAEVARAINEKSSQAMQHITQSIQNLLQYKLIKINFTGKLQEQKIDLPRSSNKKTLFIDLDQTLIHCNQNSLKEADINTVINLNGNEFKVGFNIRPYAITFLKTMKRKWQLIVFTASHQIYADKVLDEIDPDRELFDHRLYREHCRQLTPQFFVKDLSRFNRELSQSVLVDNSTYSFAMQLDNGIPIFPYYQGKDYQLAALESYLNKLVQQEDVRVMNRKYFQMFQYTSFDNSYDLVRQLYCSQKYC